MSIKDAHGSGVSGSYKVLQTKHHKYGRYGIMVTAHARKEEGSYCTQKTECISKLVRYLSSSGNKQFCTVPDHTKFQHKIKVGEQVKGKW